MGNTISAETGKMDTWWPPPNTDSEIIQEHKTCTAPETNKINLTKKIVETCENVPCTSTNTDDEYETARKKHREQKIKEFRSEWEKKHIVRREAIAERSREIVFLREELEKYKKENEQLKDFLKQNDTTESQAENLEDIKFDLLNLKNENDNLQKKIADLNDEVIKSNEMARHNLDLRKNIAETQMDLQAVNSQVLEFEKERHNYETHVIALKDVIKVSKSLLEIRENQLRELKTKVAEIETSLAEREVSMMSTDLKDEYERQLGNIRSLRALYEHRQAATKAERDLMASQLAEAKNNLEIDQKKNGEMQGRISELEENVSDKYDQIKSLESLLGLAKAEYRGLEAEMSVINQLFSQILFGFNNCKEIDFDKLIKLLEQNHDVLTNIAINEESEALSSALPKTLLDLVNQVAEENKNSETNFTDDQESSTETNLNNGSQLSTAQEENIYTDSHLSNQMNSAEDIVNKLPKVWRVLIELLRQQCGQQPVDIQDDGTDPCYKSVETPKGPKMVLSVSKTFIRLKDLILEKKSLEKEMSRLKHLNTHLEVRLQDQEKRLETVSTELSKTWHVVGKMQRQHQQLHTHEKILRYELGQKRKMLTELKQELEYCREKWEQAREKNSNTEVEWKKLRSEFASRKTAVADEINNSAESGYSDGPGGSSDEETEKRGNKTANKISRNLDSDEEHKSSSDTTKSDLTQTMSIKNQGKDDKNDRTSAECSYSKVKQKTEVEVQNVIRNTQPVSLDMIDDVCALAMSPVVIVNDVFTNQFIEVLNPSNGVTDDSNSKILPNLISNENTGNCNLETESSNKIEYISKEQISEQILTNIPNPLEVTEQINTLTTSPLTTELEITSSLDTSHSTEYTNTESEMLSNLDTSHSTEYTNTESEMLSNLDTSHSTEYTNTESEMLSNLDTSHSTEYTNTESEMLSNLDTSHSTEYTNTESDMLSNLKSNNSTEHISNLVLAHNSSSSILNISNKVESVEKTASSISNDMPSTSSSSTNRDNMSQDERLQRREERLRRLEEQCKQLVTKVANTKNRSKEMHNRLDALHEQYGNDAPRTTAQLSESEENPTDKDTNENTNDVQDSTTNQSE